MINIQGDPLRMRPLKSGKVWIESLLNSSWSGHIRAEFSAVRSYPHTVQYSPAISAHSSVRSGPIRTQYSTVRPYPRTVQYGPVISAHTTVRSDPIRSQYSTVQLIRIQYSTVRPYPLSVQYGPALFADSDSMVANVNFANHSFENKNKARAFYG